MARFVVRVRVQYSNCSCWRAQLRFDVGKGEEVLLVYSCMYDEYGGWRVEGGGLSAWELQLGSQVSEASLTGLFYSTLHCMNGLL